MLVAALGGGALFLSEHADAFAPEAAEACHQRGILAELAVAGERGEFGDQRVDVIDAMRALRMSRHLGFLPGRQARIEVFQSLRRLLLDACNLLGDVAAAGGQRAQLVDLRIELGDGLFKIQVAAHVIRHSGTLGRKRRADQTFSEAREESSPIQSFSASRTSPTINPGNRAVSRRSAPEVKAQRTGTHLSASGCRSRTRLFSRSSTTWV